MHDKVMIAAQAGAGGPYIADIEISQFHDKTGDLFPAGADAVAPPYLGDVPDSASGTAA